MAELFCLGGGGHARVILDALLMEHAPVRGVLDPRAPAGEQLFGVPVLGGDEILDGLDPSGVLLVNGVGANPSTLIRQTLFEHWRARGFSFSTVRHPSAVVGRECILAEGAQLMAGAVVQNRVRIGDNAVINTRATVDHDCVIGAHVFVAPGVVMCASVTVGDSTFVGAGAILTPGVHIGTAAVIGAGAVVTRSVDAGAVVVGNPASRIKAEH